MNNLIFTKEVLFEHQFWLIVMRNHGKFIYDALSACQKKNIRASKHFIKAFDEMLNQARNDLNSEQLCELTKLSCAYCEEFKILKQQLISEYDNTQIDLPISCLRNMISETDEYLQFSNQLLDNFISTAILSEKSENWVDSAGKNNL